MLFTALSEVPSLTKVRLVGMPIGLSPIRSSRSYEGGEPIGLGDFARSSTSPRVSRETLREELYAVVAELAAEDQRRSTVDTPEFQLPLRCLEVQGLDFGVRALYDPRSAAYGCSGDSIATYPWSSLRGLTRLVLTSVQLFRQGHATVLSQGLEFLTALRSLCVDRYSGMPPCLQELLTLIVLFGSSHVTPCKKPLHTLVCGMHGL